MSLCCCVRYSANNVWQIQQPATRELPAVDAIVNRMMSAVSYMAFAITDMAYAATGVTETLRVGLTGQHTDAASYHSTASAAAAAASQMTDWSGGIYLQQGVGASVSNAVGSALNYLSL